MLCHRCEANRCPITLKRRRSSRKLAWNWGNSADGTAPRRHQETSRVSPVSPHFISNWGLKPIEIFENHGYSCYMLLPRMLIEGMDPTWSEMEPTDDLVILSTVGTVFNQPIFRYNRGCGTILLTILIGFLWLDIDSAWQCYETNMWKSCNPTVFGMHVYYDVRNYIQ